MGVEIANESGMLGQFASGPGYADLISAVGNEYPHLQSFFDHGATEDVPKVQSELDTLIKDAKDADVVSTAKALHDLLTGQELAVIATGVEGDEAPEDSAKRDDVEIYGDIVKLDQEKHLV